MDGNLPTDASVESGCDRACACMQIAKNIFRTLQRHLRQRWRELCSEQFVVFPCLFMVFVGLEKGDSFFLMCFVSYSGASPGSDFANWRLDGGDS